MYKKILNNLQNLFILDIGANIGLVALHLLPNCERLICIEPTPSHFELLTDLTNKTKIENINIALSDIDGEIDFYFSKTNTTTNSLIKQSYHDEYKTIKTKTLSTLIKDLNLDHVDFIKVDIEGSEMIALNEKELETVFDKVNSYYVEGHTIQKISSEENAKELVSRFTNVGYKVMYLTYDSFYAFK
jgi:FkbM family methyltransferase